MSEPEKLLVRFEKDIATKWWRVGISLAGTTWAWRSLRSRKKDLAKKEAHLALVQMLNAKAEHMDATADDFRARARALREAATNPGALLDEAEQ